MKFNEPLEEEDIVDCLAQEQLDDLIIALNEPANKDTISLEEFNEATKQWRSE